MKATDVLIQCLENEGVEYVFGIVGKETLDLVESISRSSQIKYIPVRHEQGAAFMACVYGKLANKPGVCTATLGPGAGNLLTGLATALLDGSPVVAITGQTGLESQHKGSHQYLKMIQIMEPATKWTAEIKDANTIPEIVRKAFHIANEEKPGSVFLELPENLAVEPVPPKVLPIHELQPPQPDIQSIHSAIARLNQSKSPFIIVGNGVIRQGASHEVLEFATRIQAPVTNSFMAKGILPKDAPNNYFTFGFDENDLIFPGINEADLIIAIGFDMVEKLPKEWNRKKIPVLHIHAHPAEVDEYYPIALEIVGHIHRSMQLFNALDLPVKNWSPAGNLKQKIEQAYQIKAMCESSPKLPITVENILHAIEKLSPDQSIIVSDVGAHKLAIAKTYQPLQAGQVIISNGLATMGIAIPGSIGAKLAKPNDTIVCITGDGGALMTFSELETAKRLNISCIIIVLNDHILKLEQQMMNKKLGKSFGVSFSNPDFILLAKSFGMKAYRPQSLAEFEKKFESALAETGPILFEIPLHGPTSNNLN